MGDNMLSTLEKILYLRQIELFAECNAQELAIIAQKTTEKGFSKGDIIFRQGDPGDSLYLILGGNVRVIREDGKKRETVAILEELSCFGEMAILGESVRTATIESTDSLTVLRIDKEDFREMILTKPDMAFPIFKILVERLKKSTDMYMASVRARRVEEETGTKKIFAGFGTKKL